MRGYSGQNSGVWTSSFNILEVSSSFISQFTLPSHAHYYLFEAAASLQLEAGFQVVCCMLNKFSTERCFIN